MQYESLQSAKQLRKKLSATLDNLNEAIYRLEESEMDVEEGKDPNVLDWAFHEVILCIQRKVGGL